MRRIWSGLLVWLVAGVAVAATLLSPQQMRTLSASDPHGLIVKVRAALDAGDYVNRPD